MLFRTMNRLLLSIIAMLVIFSCQKHEQLVPEYQIDKDLYASGEPVVSSRTSIDQTNNILWSAGDQLIAFMKTTLGDKYQIKDEFVGSLNGGFSKVSESGSGDDLEVGHEIDHNVILYPYDQDATCWMNDDENPTASYLVRTELPHTQMYVVNSFANESFPMIAVSDENRLSFKNVCGCIKLRFVGTHKIKSIKLEGLSDEVLSGSCSIVAHVDGSQPSVEMSSTGHKDVILDCGDGVQLDETTPKVFVITVPPVTFESGMKITVTDTYGFTQVLTNSSANTVRRSCILNFPVINYVQENVFSFAGSAYETYEVAKEGATIEVPVVTDLEYNVEIPQSASSWISLAETKAVRQESINLVVSSNSSVQRSAEVNITDSVNGEVLATINIIQKSAYLFNENHCIYYSENQTGGWTSSGDHYRLYRSRINCNATGTRMEMKFKLRSFVQGHEYYLCAGDNLYYDDCDYIEVTSSMLYIYNGQSEKIYSWKWTDIGVSNTDLIKLVFSGEDETITINGKVLNCPGIKSITCSYLFSAYFREYDDGEWKEYYGVPDDSSLYYVKMYDSTGKMTYEGYASKATNSASSRIEYSWYSSTDSSYQFAYNAKTAGAYGGNF